MGLNQDLYEIEMYVGKFVCTLDDMDRVIRENLMDVDRHSSDIKKRAKLVKEVTK
jgi:hypothetical protein